MKRTDYKPRIIDGKVEEYLSTFGDVYIEGPKWCGKTWTSSHHNKSEIYIGDPAGNFQNRHLTEIAPELVLEGEAPRLIDEWQEVPPLWDAVRYKVDASLRKGQFILTGSATPNHKGILHSGAGRIGRLRMRPMSLYESGDSIGSVSLYDDYRDELTDEAIKSIENDISYSIHRTTNMTTIIIMMTRRMTKTIKNKITESQRRQEFIKHGSGETSGIASPLSFATCARPDGLDTFFLYFSLFILFFTLLSTIFF